jgi:succinate dehydrogenase / fumarate reductase cytochrome b subunit
MSVTVASRASRGLTQKQWFSLFGVVPLSVYVVLHLWTNLYALAGADAFNTRLVETRQSPTFLFLEVVGLGFPIVFHAWIGIKAVLQMRPNNVAYGRLTNWKYLLQRISAVGILLFLGAHVIKARIMPAMASPGGHEDWAGMHNALSEPLTFTVYALGLLGVAYHLANGLWLASLTWGIAVSPRAQRKMEAVTISFFVLLVIMSGLALYGFRPFME